MEPNASVDCDEGNRDHYDSHQLGYNPHVQNGGYDPQLENVRMESIRKIKGRFEHIYQKYGKDFDGVGDEIDMATGVIVVNNGHLQNMEHENDAGNGDALALSRTFEDDGDADEDDEESSSSGSEADAREGEAEDSNSVSSEHPELDFSWQDDTAASLTSPDEDGFDASEAKRGSSSAIKDASKRIHVVPSGNATSEESEPPEQQIASDDFFGNMPGLKNSMVALQEKYRNGQGMAADDIQALGMSIASQLASFITGGKPSRKRKRHTLPARLDSAEGFRGRRRQRTPSPVEPVPPTPGRSPGRQSLWAPMQRPKGRRVRKAKKVSAEPEGDDPLVDSFVLQTIMQQSALEPDELQGPTTVRSCANCRSAETLCWRKGPNGEDLCNNCGMYYYRYGLTRPLESSSTSEKEASVQPDDLDPRYKPAPYRANTSRPMGDVSLFGLHFSTREDAQLIKLKEIDNLTWDQIAMQHPGRTPYALQCRYSKMLYGKPCEAREILKARGYEFYVDSHGNTIARQPGAFTDEEDDLLLQLREEDQLGWEEIALELPGRAAEDIEKRYEEMARQYLFEDKGDGKQKAKISNKSNSKKRQRGRSASVRSSARFTPFEDEQILRLREDDNLSWQDVAKQMPGRTLASVQRRYSRDIGPYGRSRSSTPKGSPAPGEGPSRLRKYSEEEDSELMRLRDEEDLDWQEIAAHIPGRSASSLENRYYYKVRKTDSRPSSRASSVAPDSRQHVDMPPPVVNFEAEIENARETITSEGDMFTEAEDDLIVKLRELECLPWDQIAVEMPGRNVSAISCRYYQYLLPRKALESRGAESSLDPALQSSGGSSAQTRALEARNDTIEPKRNQSRSDGSTRLPTEKISETAVAATTGEHLNARKRKHDASIPGRLVTARRSDAPMLRRALQKNLNRRSESSLTAPNWLSISGMMTDVANDGPLLDGDELPAPDPAPSHQAMLPSLLPTGNEGPSEDSHRRPKSSSKRKTMYPETPLRRANEPNPSSGPTPGGPKPYITPSRHQTQSHPYFLPNAASPEESSVSDQPKTSGKQAATAQRIVMDSEGSDVESENDVASERVTRSSRKRRRAPQTARASRSTNRQTALRDDPEEDEDDDESDDHAGEYFTSRKKKRASTAEQNFRGRKPAAARANEQNENEVRTVRTRAHASEAEDETEEEDIDMPDLGTDDDEGGSASENEEDEDDDALRCRPRQRSPIFDPRHTMEEAKYRREGGPLRGKITAVARSEDGNTLQNLNADYDISDIPPEHLIRPDVSWTELNFQALKSRAPEPMYTREVYQYLEENYPFFRLCKGHWRDSIRGNLSTRPEFCKASNTKAALWTLADPNQEAVVKPAGGKRGRCPSGVERAKKAKVPKKKGRPSNASKGLPLKREYKRNYVPAEERRRLAILEAGNATTSASESVQDETTARAGAGNEIRPSRLTTIEDSDAGEQWEFVDNPSEQLLNENEIKVEPRGFENGLTTPIAPMTVQRSVPGDRAVDELSSDAAPADSALQSSSPAGNSARRDTSAHSQAAATPGTARSTLFRQIAPAPSAVKHTPAFKTLAPASSVGKGTPAFAQVAAPSRIGTPSSLRRVVQTPARDAEDSDDELA